MSSKEKDEKKPEEEKEKTEGEGESSSEGGEGAEGGEGLHPPKKKLSPKMMAIIGAGVLLLLGGGGAGLYFAGVFGGGGEPAAEGHDADGEADAHGGASGGEEKTEDAHGGGGGGGHGEGGGAPGAPVFYALGDILVNLTGDGKRPNFLKIKVSLELASEKDSETIEALKPRIIDHFQVYLRELRVEDLRGSAGLYRLREELLLRVTEAAAPVRVRDVLFQEMLVQ